jgi:transposase InsO family protein
MCKVLQVSKSGYYGWKNRSENKRSKRQLLLKEKIKRIYQSGKQRYGSPRIRQQLLAEGVPVSAKTVAKYMRQMGLQSLIRKKYRLSTTDSNHCYTISQNLLCRDFRTSTIGTKWAGDLTYIKTAEGWLYLAVVMDLADRKIVGWAMSETMQADSTTVAALKMAFNNRKIEKRSLLFHSDRGVQYACHSFRQLLQTKQVTQSMSRKGNCWDNAVVESFFKTMKTEMVYHHTFENMQQAKLSLFEYIEIWYNKQRIHSAIGYKTPCQMEQLLSNNALKSDR